MSLNYRFYKEKHPPLHTPGTIYSAAYDGKKLPGDCDAISSPNNELWSLSYVHQDNTSHCLVT